jgi:serine/threonine-protein kinase MRCK
MKLIIFIFKQSLLNDCHSLIDFIDFEGKSKVSNEAISFKLNKTDIIIKEKNKNIDFTEATIEISDSVVNDINLIEYQKKISKLEEEKYELSEKLKNLQLNSVKSDEKFLNPLTNVEGNELLNESNQNESLKELKIKLDLNQQSNDLMKDQISRLNFNLNEITNLYETTKQNELEEKNRVKHLDRSIRTLKIEKEQLITQLQDLQERANFQAKDLQEAQTQRKLAVQEFTDVNEKVNELRSKNVKLSNDLLNKEDEIEELKRTNLDFKFELDKREKIIEEFKMQIQCFTESIFKLENEKMELLQKSSYK